MRSTVLFLVMLVFVRSSTTEMELENVPEFVELSQNHVSQAFFSAAALRMKEEGSSAGFQKILALINELIHDNRKQLQSVKKINARVQSECVVVTHKLKDRAIFFQGQTKYFKRRGSVTLGEKTEAVNIKNSRIAQNKSYGTLLTAASARFRIKYKKWGDRCANAQVAVNKANAAIRVVNEWTPKVSAAFVQKSVKEAADMYSKVKDYPLNVPEELIQLSANDKKLRKRLYQWLNFLKKSIVDNLAKCQRSKSAFQRIYKSFKSTILDLQTALSVDSKELGKAIENYTILIKVYSQNEKIYGNLFDQNNLLITANQKYCVTESNNFKAGEKVIESQLLVFIKLRFWLRKNFHRVKRWIKKNYAKYQ